jgi:hypothetical protein
VTSEFRKDVATMKLFFCTVCNKMKRVRRMPRVIENAQAESPELRVGACNRHGIVSQSEYRRIKSTTNQKVGA